MTVAKQILKFFARLLASAATSITIVVIFWAMISPMDEFMMRPVQPNEVWIFVLGFTVGMIWWWRPSPETQQNKWKTALKWYIVSALGPPGYLIFVVPAPIVSAAVILFGFWRDRWRVDPRVMDSGHSPTKRYVKLAERGSGADGKGS